MSIRVVGMSAVDISLVKATPDCDTCWLKLRGRRSEETPLFRSIIKNWSARVGKSKAIVAVARKLIGRIRAAMRKHEQYKLNYKEAA